SLARSARSLVHRRRWRSGAGGTETTSRRRSCPRPPAPPKINRRGRSPGRGPEAGGVCGMVDITKQAAAISANRPCRGIDTDSAHEREIDHQPIVAGAEAATVMPTTANCDGQALLAREGDGGDHVRDICA